MSIPRRDPNFTMADLEKVGERFLEAGLAYWEAMHKAGIDGAISWLQDRDGALVLYTRGEYRDLLLNNVERLGEVYSFGSGGERESNADTR